MDVQRRIGKWFGHLGQWQRLFKSQCSGGQPDRVYPRVWLHFEAISGLIPGTNYTITFLAAERPGYSAESWKVTINGTVIQNYSPAASATSYTSYTARFTATAATETLAFVGTDTAGGDCTIFIDDVQVAITGLTSNPAPQLTTNTLPVTASDVVGSQETFTAGFTAAIPMVYQWQVISGGVTNNIPGATTTTLTLTNLQLTNTASYQVLASNVFGVAVSTPSSLTVSAVPRGEQRGHFAGQPDRHR